QLASGQSRCLADVHERERRTRGLSVAGCQAAGTAPLPDRLRRLVEPCPCVHDDNPNSRGLGAWDAQGRQSPGHRDQWRCWHLAPCNPTRPSGKTRRCPVKQNVALTIASLLSILFTTLHVTDDIVRGWEQGTLSDLIVVPILVVWLYGTLVLAG